MTTTQLMLKGRLRSEVRVTGQTSDVSWQAVCASCVVAIVGSANKVMHDMIVFLLSLSTFNVHQPPGKLHHTADQEERCGIRSAVKRRLDPSRSSVVFSAQKKQR
jgi:hypothetical protein